MPVEWYGNGTPDGNYAGEVYDSHPGVGLDDSVSSVWNNTNRWVKLCQNVLCIGAPDTSWALCFAPGGAHPALGNIVPIYTNNASSHGFPPGGKPGGCSHYIYSQGCSM